MLERRARHHHKTCPQKKRISKHSRIIPQRTSVSARTGPRRLEHAKRLEEREERLDALRLAAHLHDHAVLAHVDDTPPELRREHLHRVQVVALEPERLARGERRRGLGLRGVLEVLREGGLAL